MSESSFLFQHWPALAGVALVVVALAVTYKTLDRINRRRGQLRRRGVHRAGSAR